MGDNWRNISIHIPKPGESPSEAKERYDGWSSEKLGVMEAGTQFPAFLLRKERASEALQQVAKVLYALKQKAADLQWDDEKVGVFIGIQIRNNWQQGPDGEWYEMGSEKAKDLWLKGVVAKEITDQKKS